MADLSRDPKISSTNNLSLSIFFLKKSKFNKFFISKIDLKTHPNLFHLAYDFICSFICCKRDSSFE